jgi:hypothetical protein
MKTWKKVLAVTLLFAIPAFVLGPVIWPLSANLPAPAPEQVPYFILLSVFDSLFFGLRASEPPERTAPVAKERMTTHG